MSLIQICVHLELTASKAEARRLIEQGGLYVDETRVSSVDEKLSPRLRGDTFVLRAGKKKRLLVQVKH